MKLTLKFKSLKRMVKKVAESIKPRIGLVPSSTFKFILQWTRLIKVMVPLVMMTQWRSTKNTMRPSMLMSRSITKISWCKTKTSRLWRKIQDRMLRELLRQLIKNWSVAWEQKGHQQLTALLLDPFWVWRAWGVFQGAYFSKINFTN